jgi:hypothetical protein
MGDGLKDLFKTDPELALIESLKRLREKVKSAGCYVPLEESLNTLESYSVPSSEAEVPTP